MNYFYPDKTNSETRVLLLRSIAVGRLLVRCTTAIFFYFGFLSPFLCCLAVSRCCCCWLPSILLLLLLRLCLWYLLLPCLIYFFFLKFYRWFFVFSMFYLLLVSIIKQRQCKGTLSGIFSRIKRSQN